MRRRVLERKSGRGWGWVVKAVALVMALTVVGLVMVESKWNGKNRVGVVFVGNEGGVSLMSVQPGGGAVVVSFGSKVKVPVVGGYGLYRVGVVNDLGRQEKLGPKLLERSLSSWLGTAVIGSVMGVEEGKLGDLSVLRWSLVGMPRGDLAWWDRLWLWWAIGRVRASEVEVVHAGEGDLVEAEVLPDGELELNAAQVRLAARLKGLLVDELVTAGGFEMAVVNGTNHRGLAREVSEKLGMVGYDVVAVPELDKKYEQTVVIIDKALEVDEGFMWPLKQLLPYRYERAEGVNGKFRAGVVVVVGEDYWRDLEGASN